jgi:hypothetical protein
MNEIESIERSLGEAKTQETALAERIQTIETVRRGLDRSFIVRCVMAAYLFAIVVCIIYLIIRGLYCREDTFDNIAEIIKIAVVPVVTFVIGYYFATERRT